MRDERGRRVADQGRERGATAIEYGLLVALIAIVMIAAVSLMSRNLSNVFMAAAESFATTESDGPAAAAQVKPGGGTFLRVSQLTNLQNLAGVKLLSATVDDASKGKAKAEDTGISFEAAGGAKGQASITYRYSYKKDKKTITGQGSVLVNIA